MDLAAAERPLNRDIIKYIAMVTMLLNHIANVFLPHGTILYEILVDIGYFTAPTMCYFLVEGYQYTRSKRNYGLRLLGLAVLSQFPFALAIASPYTLNMIFTLLLCFLILVVDEKVSYKSLRILLNGLLTLISIIADWPIFAPVFTMLFRWAGKDRRRIAVAYGTVGFFFFATYRIGGLFTLTDFLLAAASTLGIAASGIVILYFYNGKRIEKGRDFSKWFFYLFYPAHLLALGLIRDFLVFPV